MWTCLSVGQLITSDQNLLPSQSQAGKTEGQEETRNPVRHNILSKQNIGSDLVVTVFVNWKLVKSSTLQGVGLGKVGVGGRCYGLM